MDTYQPEEVADGLEDCLPCEDGYICSSPGTGNLTDVHLCPEGFWCQNASIVPCLSGTYRDVPGARSRQECFPCDGGYMCPDNATITPLPCPEAEYCPVGSVEPLECPGTFFCGVTTEVPELCPGGYFCPNATDAPLLCPESRYCPPGVDRPYLCPRGTRVLPTTQNSSRVVLEDACEICPAGTYSDLESSPTCFDCPPGFVCAEPGVQTARPQTLEADGGYPCPVGHYCPTGSVLEAACPSGTFNALSQQGFLANCTSCRAGFYNSELGQSTCIPCSSSSTSPPRSSTCDCIGLNRVFQPSDGKCICAPQHEFLDEDFVARSDEDSTADCQPQIYDQCFEGAARGEDGQC